MSTSRTPKTSTSRTPKMSTSKMSTVDEITPKMSTAGDESTEEPTTNMDEVTNSIGKTKSKSKISLQDGHYSGEGAVLTSLRSDKTTTPPSLRSGKTNFSLWFFFYCSNFSSLRELLFFAWV